MNSTPSDHSSDATALLSISPPTSLLAIDEGESLAGIQETLSAAFGRYAKDLVAVIDTSALRPDASLEEIVATREERLHQTRVGLRRMRNLLRIFATQYEPSWRDTLQTELTWFAHSLGISRDLDVLIRTLDNAKIDDALRPAIAHRLETELLATRKELIEVRQSTRFDSLLCELKSLPTSIQFEARGSVSAKNDWVSLLKPTWRSTKKVARRALEKSSTNKLHRLRIELKRLQYGCEIALMEECKGAHKTAFAAESLQAQLGKTHDLAVAIDWVSTLRQQYPEYSKSLVDVVRSLRRGHRKEQKGWCRNWRTVERRWKKMAEAN